MLEQLRDRQRQLTLEQKPLFAEQLGNSFKLLAYRHPVLQLAEHLRLMLKQHEWYCTHPRTDQDEDAYHRTEHILRLLAAPGLGKTTALRSLWPCLHQACTNLDQLSTNDFANLRSWVTDSLGPQQFLVYQHSISGTGTS